MGAGEEFDVLLGVGAGVLDPLGLGPRRPAPGSIETDPSASWTLSRLASLPALPFMNPSSVMVSCELEDEGFLAFFDDVMI